VARRGCRAIARGRSVARTIQSGSLTWDQANRNRVDSGRADHTQSLHQRRAEPRRGGVHPPCSPARSTCVLRTPNTHHNLIWGGFCAEAGTKSSPARRAAAAPGSDSAAEVREVARRMAAVLVEAPRASASEFVCWLVEPVKCDRGDLGCGQISGVEAEMPIPGEEFVGRSRGGSGRIRIHLMGFDATDGCHQTIPHSACSVWQPAEFRPCW
jgi:hypothetical protein